MKRVFILFITLAAFAACQSRETATSETIGTETTAASTAATETVSSQGANRVEVHLVEYEIHMPTSVPAGSTTFVVTNGGKVTHSFEIEGNGMERELSASLQPGATDSLTLDLTPGSYKVYCPVEDHDEKHGMRTTLTVS